MRARKIKTCRSVRVGALALLALGPMACEGRLDAGYNRKAPLDAGLPETKAATRFEFDGQAVSLQLNGDAVGLTDGIDLTRARANQQGTAYLPMALNLAAATSISVFAEFAINATGPAAEGIAFVWHSDAKGIFALGGTGGDLSIGNIKPSLAVVFDTHNGNGRELAPNVSIGHGGDFSGNPVVTRASPFVLTTGASVFVWIDYSVQGCKVYVSDSASRPLAPWIEAPVNLRTELGDSAFFGVASSTGAVFSRQRLLALRVDVVP